MGLGSFLFGKSFGATKARVKEAALTEFAEFIVAIDGWNSDRTNSEARAMAVYHFEVYDQRRADYVNDPTGRSLPPERALMASFWVEALADSRLLDSDGRQSRWNEGAVLFWDTVERLRNERDLLQRLAEYADE